MIRNLLTILCWWHVSYSDRVRENLQYQAKACVNLMWMCWRMCANKPYFYKVMYRIFQKFYYLSCPSDRVMWEREGPTAWPSSGINCLLLCSCRRVPRIRFSRCHCLLPVKWSFGRLRRNCSGIRVVIQAIVPGALSTCDHYNMKLPPFLWFLPFNLCSLPWSYVA